MRVLFVSYAEKTHFIGLVPLAWAMRAAGHDVRVAGQPELAPFVAGTGLPYAPVGTDHRLREWVEWAARWDPEPTGGLFDVGDRWPEELPWKRLLLGMEESVEYWWNVINEPMLDDLVDLCDRWRPDLVVWETTTYAAGIAAEACGAAHARYLWSLDMFGRMRAQFLRTMAAQPEADRADPLRDWLADRAARHGVAFSESLVDGDAAVDQLPDALRIDPGPAVRRLPVRYVPYNGRAVVPEWLRRPADRPRICLTMGTSATEWYGGYAVSMAGVLDGLADLDAEVVATLPVEQQQRLGTVPGNVRLVDYVPLHALAPTCAAMVNHGGPGTVCTGLAAGVPQLILAVADLDAPLLARNVAEAGAGITLSPEQTTTASVTGAVARLLGDPAFAAGADRVRAQMAAMPAPAGITADLAALAARRAELRAA
jgi:glycosyltransferase (activator-dependent family)|nr:activator-dependent family glycosyltransferase [Nocardiopsis trehalosi]